MFSVHSTSTEIKKDFLLSCIKAKHLAAKDFYCFVDKVTFILNIIYFKIPDSKLFKDFIAIKVLLIIQQEDEQWSLNVLDVSHTSSTDFIKEYEAKQSLKKHITPGKAQTKPLSGDQFLKGSLQKRDPEDLNVSFYNKIFK